MIAGMKILARGPCDSDSCDSQWERFSLKHFRAVVRVILPRLHLPAPASKVHPGLWPTRLEHASLQTAATQTATHTSGLSSDSACLETSPCGGWKQPFVTSSVNPVWPHQRPVSEQWCGMWIALQVLLFIVSQVLLVFLVLRAST